MGNKEWTPSDVFDVFGDELARRILVLTSEQPLSADELADCLDASAPTVYRRLNGLVEYGLVAESRRIDEDGNHYKTFATTLKRVSFEITEGGYTIDLEMRRSLADQFDTFWSDFERSSPRTGAGPGPDRDAPDRSPPDDRPDDLSHG